MYVDVDTQQHRNLIYTDTGPMTSPDRKPPYQGCLSCMSGGQTPVEAYVEIKQAYLGSFGE